MFITENHEAMTPLKRLYAKHSKMALLLVRMDLTAGKKATLCTIDDTLGGLLGFAGK